MRGAQAAGFPTDLWNLERVARVIEREFGVRYHPRYVWHILTGMGWSAQKLARRLARYEWVRAAEVNLDREKERW